MRLTAPGYARRCRTAYAVSRRMPMSDLSSPHHHADAVRRGSIGLYFEDAPLHRTHHGGIFQGLSSAAAPPSLRCGACCRPCRGADTAAPRARAGSHDVPPRRQDGSSALPPSARREGRTSAPRFGAFEKRSYMAVYMHRPHKGPGVTPWHRRFSSCAACARAGRRIVQ